MLLVTGTILSGCRTVPTDADLLEIAMSDVPRELDKVSYPEYRVEPPDILVIEAVNNIRPANDPLRAGDQLVIRVGNTFPIDPDQDQILNEFKYINNIFMVQSDGSVDLGPEYHSVRLSGLTLDQAKTAISNHLKSKDIGLKNPLVAISMQTVQGKQPITGEHLVRPDGTISLGVYGSVSVAGLTLAQIKATVEEHLAKFIHKPEVNADVLAYNSKVCYVITDGGGFGEQVVKIPFTGNETVLDAVSQIQGLSDVSSKQMWVARPSPAGTEVAQVLPVDYRAITQDAITTTNYQLFPGDRIYIKADNKIMIDNFIAKTLAPINRIAGFILLGNGVVRRLQTNNLGSSGSGSGGF